MCDFAMLHALIGQRGGTERGGEGLRHLQVVQARGGSEEATLKAP